MRLTLNISPCPNDTFMFDALVNGRIDTGGYCFDVTFADIEDLNRRIMSGTGAPDISKISYAALPAIHDRYRLLDSGSALGHGNGPVLVARHVSCFPRSFPLHFKEGWRSKTAGLADGFPLTEGWQPQVADGGVTPCVAIPGIHTTANLLLQRLYSGLTDRRPMLFSDIAPAVARGDVDAGVLIHEGRFTYRDHGLELVADLGVEWAAATGDLPLPLGAIVASRSLPSHVATDVEALIRRSIEHAFSHPAVSRDFIKSHAREMDDNVIDNHISLFVNDNSLALSPSARLAIRTLTGI